MILMPKVKDKIILQEVVDLIRNRNQRQKLSWAGSEIISSIFYSIWELEVMSLLIHTTRRHQDLQVWQIHLEVLLPVESVL